MKLRRGLLGLGADVKDQPFFPDRQLYAVGARRHHPVITLGQIKDIAFDQVKHRHFPLLLDLGRGRGQIGVIQFDMADTTHFTIFHLRTIQTTIARRIIGQSGFHLLG